MVYQVKPRFPFFPVKIDDPMAESTISRVHLEVEQIPRWFTNNGWSVANQQCYHSKRRSCGPLKTNCHVYGKLLNVGGLSACTELNLLWSIGRLRKMVGNLRNNIPSYSVNLKTITARSPRSPRHRRTAVPLSFIQIERGYNGEQPIRAFWVSTAHEASKDSKQIASGARRGK